MRALDRGRYEIKYALDAAACDALVARLGGVVLPDAHADVLPSGKRGYVVQSTYFDTPTLLDYTARLAQERVRRRVRVRTYGARGERRPVFLEIKRKLDAQVIKHRGQVCDTATWEGLGERPWEALCDVEDADVRAMARRFTDIVRQVGLVPNVAVRYEREVYVDARADKGAVRLTIDRHVTGARVASARDLYPPPEMPLVPDPVSVLELKFDGGEPAWMRGIVRELGLHAEPISKYALAVATLLRADRPREVRSLLPRCARRAA